MSAGWRVPLCVLLSLLLSVGLCGRVSGQQILGCGAFGIDFSSLSAYDIVSPTQSTTGVNTFGSFFRLRMCAPILQSLDPTCYASGTNVFFCQHNGVGTCTYVFPSAVNAGSWSGDAATWSYVNNDNSGSSGYQMTVYEGLACGNNDRISVVQLVCDQFASVPYSTGTVENPGCTYTMTVYTQLACAQTSTRTITGCGFGQFDFSPLATYDITAPDTSNDGWTYNLHVCGPLTYDRSCSLAQASYWNAANSMVCQHGVQVISSTQHTNCNPYSNYLVGTWAQGLTQWQYLDGVTPSSGVMMTISDGQPCGSTNRTVVYYFLCGPNRLPSTAVAVEVQSCFYAFEIYTSLACTSGQKYSSCNGKGYDLSYFEKTEMIGTDPNRSYLYSMALCGVTSNLYCLSDTNDVSRYSMACQLSNDFTSAYALASYSPSPSAFNWTWINGRDYTGGVQVSIKDGSSISCGFRRTSVIQILCNSKAVKPVYMQVVESPACTYTFTIYYWAVCYAPGSALLPTIATGDDNPVTQSGGSLNVSGLTSSPGCSFGGYNFAALGSVTYNETDQNAPLGQGAYYLFRLCGIASDWTCIWASGITNPSFCQHTSYNPFVTYVVSEYDQRYNVWSWVNGADWSDGVQLTMADGTLCGSNPRVGVVRIVCDPTLAVGAVAYGWGIAENPGCTYTNVIRTSMLCYPPGSSGPTGGNPNTNTGGSSQSSSSPYSITASALTAAIVVPVVVALLILLACCLCCILGTGSDSFRGGGKTTKTTSIGDADVAKNTAAYKQENSVVDSTAAATSTHSATPEKDVELSNVEHSHTGTEGAVEA